MENERLKELKLSLYINHIDKSDNKIEYSNIIKIMKKLRLLRNETEQRRKNNFIEGQRKI